MRLWFVAVQTDVNSSKQNLNIQKWSKNDIHQIHTDTLRRLSLLGVNFRKDLIKKMDILSGYMVDIEYDYDVNKIIKWWNDILFEQGYVPMDEFELQCDIDPEFNHRGYCWTFDLTTDFIEFYNRKDAYHVKSGWKIKLPEPELKSSLKELNYD